MEILATVFPWRNRLDELARKFLPLVMPWILFPSGISIFAAFVRACANNSPYELIVLAVIPMALWVGFSKCAGAKMYGRAFAPSSVAALIATMAATYVLQITSAVSGVYNVFFGGACLALGASFWRMIISDPGRVTPLANSPVSLHQMPLYGELDHEKRSGVSSVSIRVDDRAQQEQYCSTCNIMQPLRAKHCKFCNVCIERFDHHCPAAYNCIGLKNHRHFLGLLVAFIITELLYVNSCVIYLRGRHSVEETAGDKRSQQTGDFYNEMIWVWKGVGEIVRGDTWVLSTAAFAGIQALWQVPFLFFHIYCACYNLTTNDVFHLDKYPGVHLEDSLAHPVGRPLANSHLVKQYTKGMKQNVVTLFGPRT